MAFKQKTAKKKNPPFKNVAKKAVKRVVDALKDSAEKPEIESPPFVSDGPEIEGKGMEILKYQATALVRTQDLWNRVKDGEFPGQMQIVCRGARDWLKKQK